MLHDITQNGNPGWCMKASAMDERWADASYAHRRMQSEDTLLHRPAAEPLRENSTGRMFSTSPWGLKALKVRKSRCRRKGTCVGLGQRDHAKRQREGATLHSATACCHTDFVPVSEADARAEARWEGMVHLSLVWALCG